LPLGTNFSRAADTARQALAIFTEGAGKDGPARTVTFLPPFDHLDMAARLRVKETVYELLLVLAEAEAWTARTAAPDERTERLGRALRLMGRAESLGFRTIAW